MRCLSSDDINRILALYPSQPVVDAALFYRFRFNECDAAFVRDKINSALESCSPRGLFVVAHFRHHWLCLNFNNKSPKRDSDTRSIRVFDSAPSPMVKRDLHNLCATLNWPTPELAPSPKQARDTEECGLFAIAAVILGQAGIELPCGTFSLAPLRDILKRNDAAMPKEFIDTVKSIYFGTDRHATLADTLSSAYFCDTCKAEIQVPEPTQRPNIVKTHNLSTRHLAAARGQRTSAAKHSKQSSIAIPTPVGGADNQLLAPNNPDDAPQRCTAATQAKRGGNQCSSPAVKLGLCKMHLLLAHSGLETCTATTKAGKRCNHKAVRGLEHCVFHVSDAAFITWAEEFLAAQPDQNDRGQETTHGQEIIQDAQAPQGDEPPNDDPFEALDDPDLEDELHDIVGRWEVPHASNAIPPLPLTAKFADARAFLRKTGPTAHPLSSMAWRRTTLLGHRRAIRHLLNDHASADIRILNAPLIPAILELVSRRRHSKKWSWTTTLRTLAEIAGALRNLPISQGIPSLELSNDQQWAAAIRGVAGRAKAERPRVPRPISAEQVQQALQAEPKRHIRLLLATTWLCCGRTGDCRQLHSEDLALNGDTLTVTFRRGKTIEKRGPFSLHTTFPAGWRNLLEIPDGDVTWAAQLAKASVQDVLKAVRRVAADLENRSIRRGALQTLASAGVSEELLMLFSGHTSIDTLRRYLAWGAVGAAKKAAMSSAASALAPTGAGAKYAHNPYAKQEPPPSYADALRLGRENERWLQFLGQEAPPLEELPIPRQQVRHAEDLPLSSKDVAGTIQMDVVHMIVNTALGNKERHQPSPQIREWAQSIPRDLAKLAKESFRWLHDPTRYELLAEEHAQRRTLKAAPSFSRTRRFATCHLNDQDFEIQQKLKKYEQAERLVESEILTWMRIFTVPEWHKARRRHIAEPLINDWFSQTPTIKFRSRQQRHQIVRKFAGGVAATLDLSSYFDQFSLADGVKKYFGISFKDRTSRMNVLPMGFRPSAQIAQVLTWILCAGLDCADIAIMTYIDNICIIGSNPAQVAQVRATILARAALIGAVFNTEGIDSPPSPVFEFLGESFDLSGKDATAALSEKTLAKINLIEEKVFENTMTRKQLAAVVGLFMFASGAGLAHNSIYKRYHALRFYRDQVSWAQSGRVLNEWGKKCNEFTPQATQSFREWLNDLRSNKPTIIPPPSRHATTDVLFTDACETGWGALHVTRDGCIRIVEGRWSPTDSSQWNMSSSVASEPLGVARALCKCITPGPDVNVVVYTDHQPIIPAVQSTCSKAFTYWVLQKTVRQLCEKTGMSINVRHIPGTQNPADGISRSGLSDQLWHSLINDAMAIHQSHEAQHEEHGEDGMPEWAETARNPLRALFG